MIYLLAVSEHAAKLKSSNYYSSHVVGEVVHIWQFATATNVACGYSHVDRTVLP